ncbi:MAG: hypothetical protein EAX90_09635 [Candidatus Heimdallarchaeota archaeon]|nr:hypothetical protein [Candidatus Heimdallarchaeota archaeon]
MKITNYVLVEISRQKGAAAIQAKGFSEDLIKELLIDALPLGNPENQVFKIISKEKNLYMSYLVLDSSKDYGLALIIQLDENLQKQNPIGYLEGINTLLITILKSDERILPDEIDLGFKEPKYNEEQYENFENFVFSILTQQKTLIVGEKDEIKSFLTNFYNYIPNELKRYITLIANSSNITNKVDLHAIIISDEVLKLIDTKKGEYTILFLPTKTAYGTYTSPFCKKIALLVNEQKKESVKEELLDFFKLAVSSNELIPAADFAANNDLSLADASLAQWIRANHYGLEIQKSIFEQLD